MKRSHFAITIIYWYFSLYLVGCSTGENKNTDTDTFNTADSIENIEEDIHADNDIAMTIRSIVDAINLEEPLDSASYSFTGVLTDGSGKPLYTDMEGNPGKWEVQITSPSMANIRNLHPGDLLPDALCTYITESLKLDKSDLITARVYEDSCKEIPTNVRIYDFGKGNIHLETRMETTASGDLSPVVSISIMCND